MNINLKISSSLILFLLGMTSVSFSNDQAGTADAFCESAECRKFEKLYDARQYEKVIELANSKTKYDEGSVFYIGQSFVVMSDNRSLTIEQKEDLLKKALAFGYYRAYMALYALYGDTNPKKALNFVKLYAATNPDDPDPFFTLGEAEFQRNNYLAADTYLRKSKKLSLSHTTGLDWLLFKVNYILGNYKYSAEMLDSALAQGTFTEEIKELKKDKRFQGIEKKPEFKEFRGWFQSK